MTKRREPRIAPLPVGEWCDAEKGALRAYLGDGGARQSGIDVELLRLSTYRSVSGIMRAGRPGPEGSMLKVLWSELEQRIMEAAGWMSGSHAALDEHAPQALDAGRWQYGALWSRAATIYAGTSEVQRNIIAQRVLGLPRA